MYKAFAWDVEHLSSVLYFYLFGLVVAVNIVTAESFFDTTKLDFILIYFEKTIRYLSGKTFTLYLMHLPIMMLLCVIIPPLNIMWSCVVIF